ncbi:MAG: S-layer homology domain-containing protein [Chloroflexi bacterium]|nr:S-layer homology domain-containing protein [Chloroflexota bacterium]
MSYSRLAPALRATLTALISFYLLSGFSAKASTLHAQPPAEPPTKANEQPASSDTAECAPWHTVPTPGVNGNEQYFYGVASISANDAWAVGARGAFSQYGTLIMHWDGANWSNIAAPNASPNNALRAVAATASNDVWAVGSASSQPMAMHWNGADWAVVPTPALPSGGELVSVTAIAPNDVWAVGGAGMQTLTMHWNGSAWATVPSPNPGSNNRLLGVTALASNDLWAVGYQEYYGRALAMHWNGSAWTAVPVPVASTDTINYLSSVSGVSGGDVWAVGSRATDITSKHTMIMHWNGTQWSIAPGSDPPGNFRNNALVSVAAIAANDVWAVGNYGADLPTLRAQFLHWNGTAWYAVPTLITTPGVQLYSMDATSHSNVWAVGDTLNGNAPRPLATGYNGGITFSDVSPSDYFYNAVSYLLCSGAIAGYPDNTFRPGATVTRGQISKIVSSAFGFNEPAIGQSFQDVPPDSTFYLWVQRLSQRGIINGYPCGGPGEPCSPPANLPYFRPNATVTRAQTAKIVSNAAGYNDPPTGQSFTDVPPSSPFYPYVQRLTARGIMAGYSCGGPGEPCDAQSRPYFRADNTATRAQAAKIVYNAVQQH